MSYELAGDVETDVAKNASSGFALNSDASVFARMTTRVDGDFQVDDEPLVLAARRKAVVNQPWVWVRQVHGGDVAMVTADNARQVCGVEADAMVTKDPNLALVIHTADCAPVLLHSVEGVIGAAHAGWRGIVAGVLQATVTTMREVGATGIVAVVGPCIHAECYEFGSADLDRVADRYGDGVRAITSSGAPALDVVEAVRAALKLCDLPEAASWTADCTACHADRYFSHRARAESERMATVVWREE